MKKTTITLTIDEVAAAAVAKGVRLDVLKRTGAVAGGLVRLNNVDYDWQEFISSYWQATNVAKSTAKAGKTKRTSYSLK